MSLVANKKPKKPTSGESEEPRKQSRSGVPIQIWVSPELDAALKKYRAMKKPRPSTTATIILAMEQLFESEGLWPPPPVE